MVQITAPTMAALPTRLLCPKQAMRKHPKFAAAAFAAAFCFLQGNAAAWVFNINPAPRAVYLQVGNGTNLADNTTINEVTVSVPAASLGNSAPQAMTSNSTQSISFIDNFAVCTPPAQVYVGGFYRLPAASATSAVLQVTTPPSLTNGTSTIAFSQISWVSTANGANTAPDIPSGTFNGSTLFLRNIATNTWVENCHIFSYANTAVVDAGTYTGRAVYTLTAP
jgi:hypothetical protein